MPLVGRRKTEGSSLLLVVFGIGVFFTTLPVANYLSNFAVYDYFLKCATLINGVVFYLPGVFADNPYKRAVNVSLWTMPYEIRMYLILALTWLVLGVVRNSRESLFKLFVVASYLVYLALLIACHFYYPSEYSRFFLMFFSGGAYFVLRDHIKLCHSVFLFCMIFLVATALINTHIFSRRMSW